MRVLLTRVGDALRLTALALVTVGIGYLAWMGLDGSLAGMMPQRLPALDQATLGERVLVIAPHPDDETIGAGGLTTRARDEGRRVTVVVATCGDGFRRIVGRYRHAGDQRVSPFVKLGEVRAGESRRATGLLGLPRRDLVFLGYPDGSMADVWSGNGAQPVKGANGRTAVPYAFAYRPGASYTASSVMDDLAAIVASVSPTAVVYPDGDDSNPDHWAVNAFTELALDRAAYTGARYTYLVHRGHFPFPWSYLPNGWVEPPRNLSRIGIDWRSLPLDRATEQRKARALESYASQWRAMEPFLTAFVRRNEMFARRAPVLVPANGTDPSRDGTATPGLVLRDPTGDTLLRISDPAADLRAVAVVRTRDTVWFGIEAQATPTRSVRYLLCARLVRDDGSIGRLEAEVSGGRATLLRQDGATASSTPLASRMDERRVWVRLPSSVFTGARVALVGAETRQGGVALDRTSCATVLLR